MKDFSQISNIIFDIGNVLLNISPLKVVDALEKISIYGKNLDKLLDSSSGFYLEFEVGALNSSQFREKIRSLVPAQLSDQQIDQAWCSMLEEFDQEKIRFLQKLSKKYRIFILSNTNEIHVNAMNKQLMQKFGIEGLHQIVEKAYYSNEIKLAKPHAEIYEYVLNDAKLNVYQTLFIDDRLDNITTAKKLGFNILHYTTQQPFDELLGEFLKK